MNIATESMKKMTEMLKAIDGKYKEFATEPYRMEKATPQDQANMYNNLTEAQLYGMIEKHGIESVSKWLNQMEQRSK